MAFESKGAGAPRPEGHTRLVKCCFTAPEDSSRPEAMPYSVTFESKEAGCALSRRPYTHWKVCITATENGSTRQDSLLEAWRTRNVHFAF